MSIEWKQLPAEGTEIGADTEKREITAYASVFGVVDQVGDIVHRGAFTQTLKHRMPKNLIKVLGFHRELIGELSHAEEDTTGLLTVSKISKTRGGDEVLELARDGALTHMSIGYEAVKHDQSTLATGRTVRNLREIKLFEVSPVDFPANEEARILSVKTARKDIGTFAEVLRSAQFVGDVAGEALTEEEARAVLTIMLAMLPPESPLRERIEALTADPGDSTPEPEAVEAEESASAALAELVSAVGGWTNALRGVRA